MPAHFKTVGGAVASWLVCSSPDRAVLVRAGDIVLCSWARDEKGEQLAIGKLDGPQSKVKVHKMIGSLSNDDDDAYKNMNLYFTSEIRDCRDLFSTPMTPITC